MENFLDQTQVLLPVLGIDFFIPPLKLPTPLVVTAPGSPLVTSNDDVGVAQGQSPLFVLTTTKGANTVNAEAQLVNNKFVVRQGAIVSPKQSALTAAYSAQRMQLRQNGKLVDDSQANKWVLAEDVTFASPSAAAAVICGYNINGPQTWKVKGTQQTYSTWLQAQVSAATASLNTPQTVNGMPALS